MKAASPALGKKWPKKGGPRQDQKTKAPTSARRVGIDPAGPDQREWNGEDQAAEQVNGRRE